MQEEIKREWRTARKTHQCNYCLEPILPGERYELYVGKYDGELFEWKSHEICTDIAHEIWDYVDPWDGMGEEEFREGCRDVCGKFICPDCEEYNWEEEGCDNAKGYCKEKLAELFRTKELYRYKRDEYGDSWWRIRDRRGTT